MLKVLEGTGGQGVLEIGGWVKGIGGPGGIVKGNTMVLISRNFGMPEPRLDWHQTQIPLPCPSSCLLAAVSLLPVPLSLSLSLSLLLAAIAETGEPRSLTSSSSISDYPGPRTGRDSIPSLPLLLLAGCRSARPE